MFSGQVEFEPENISSSGQSQVGQSQVGQSQPGQSEPRQSPPLHIQIDSHLSLRPLEPADATELFVIVHANRTYLRQWLPWLDTNQAVDDSLIFIQDSQERSNSGNGFNSAICYNAQIVGAISLNYINWGNRLSEIGYWVAAPYQGQGIVTRASKAVLSHGFTELNLNRIEIRCAAENRQSQAVATRLGLTYEGTLRNTEWLYDHFVDLQIYSMLQQEWPKED